jgi:hypothetical protein
VLPWHDRDPSGTEISTESGGFPLSGLLCETMPYAEPWLEATFLPGGYRGGDHRGDGLPGRMHHLHVVDCWPPAVRVPTGHADAEPDDRHDLTCAWGDGVRAECRR